MGNKIAMIATPLRETTGEPGPRVVYELCRFENLGTDCRVCTSAEGDQLDITLGSRRFAVSLLDLAATAAVAAQKHLHGEIRARVLAGMAARDRPSNAIPVRGVVEADGFITLHPRRP